MDIFSLLEAAKADPDGDDSLFTADDDDEGFRTPRSLGDWSLSSSAPSTPGGATTPRRWGGGSTPRKGSTPRATPPPASSPPSSFPSSPLPTPPRPTSRVDDRIRTRRERLSATPPPSPEANRDDSPSEGSVEGPPLCRRIADLSFSSDDDWNRSEESNRASDRASNRDEDERGGGAGGGRCPATPRNSPRKTDLLSLSPLQERLDRARSRRERILEERAQNIELKSTKRDREAARRKEDRTSEKVEKARTMESIDRAREARSRMLDERVREIESKARAKEAEARRRKEDATLEKVEKARSELAKSPQVKERRDQALATRREGLEADLAARAEHARARSQRHLAEKQRRASRQERRGRAERRRALDVYERRARLLGALDARLEGAAVRSREIVEEKAAKAGEDVDKAKEVARRVRAARAIQRAARDAYGLEGPDVVGEGSAPSQREAARRLRRWLPWRARACARRLAADNGGDGEPARAIDALERLLGLFPLAGARGRRRPSSPPTFDELGRRMMRPDTLKMASAVVWALRPINEASFASDEGPCPKMDGRTLLSLLLIAVHPREVLGEDCDIPSSGSGEDAKDDKAKHDKSGAGSRLLAVKSRALVEALNDLLGDGQDLPTEVLVQISSLCLETVALFAWWKDLDLRRLLAGLSRQLEQSWVVYLSSSETLRYLTEATGVDPTTAREAKDKQRRDDPLMSLRIRHEAGRSGSRSHIKRVRLSLNKLVGMDEAKDVVKSAKAAALKEMEEAGTMKDLKGEIDEICGRLGLTSSQDLSEGSEVPESENGPAGIDRDAENSEQSGQLEDLPQEILTNRLLVHRILVTDPADFEKLSWDGSDARSPNSTPEEFMASIDAVTSEDSNDVAPSMEDMSSRIAQTMRLAFFRKIADEMKGGDFQSIQELLMELHAKMRSLLPSRKDLHSHVNDESVASCHSVSDILRALVSIGYLLAGYLESAARAPTTRELIGCLEAFVSRPCDEGGLGVPYGIETKELFVVTSAGYLLQKAELCQFDLANYKLSRAAPLLHLMGHEYERRNFRELCGDYTTSSVVGLKDILPSTWTWVQRSQDQFGESDRLTMQSGLEHKMDFIMGRGFVDGILFTQSQLALPEVLSLDAEGIEHVRRKAQRCVIASALALHAGNISRVGTSSLAPTDAVDNARQALSLALERMYNRQEELETNVIKAVSALTTVLAEKDLTMDENAALKNHTLAVIRGEDPVLKLLDNRVRSFFRFACRWRPDSSNTGAVAPSKMKTGRPMFSTGDSASVPQSTKGEFMKAARRETSRLGFSHFGHDLVEAAHDARLIATLLCVNYGKDILSRFLSMACESV